MSFAPPGSTWLHPCLVWGLEVPSSNLGAPTLETPAHAGFSFSERQRNRGGGYTMATSGRADPAPAPRATLRALPADPRARPRSIAFSGSSATAFSYRLISDRYGDHETELVGRVADDVSNSGAVAVWEFDGRADVRGAVERRHHHRGG